MRIQTNSSRVLVAPAKLALDLVDDVKDAYAKYIKLIYYETGRLSPGCNARDLAQWYRINMPEEYAEKKAKRNRERV